jgi:prepilin peptidase CpaA
LEQILFMRTIAWWPTVAVLAVATVTDLRSRRIPNWLVLPFLVAGVIVSGWMRGWHGIGQSFAGLALGGFLFGVLAWMGGMGMGDVKLLAAIGAWIWPQQLIIAMVMTGIAGGVMAICWAVAGGFLRQHPELALNNPLARKMPYAPAIAVGTLMSFFSK